MLTQDQTQTQQPRIDPKIIMANAVLQLSGMELQQAVEQELAENPALELEDEDPCLGCDLEPFACRDCQHSNRRLRSSPNDLLSQDADYIFDFTSDPDDENDPIGRIQAEVTLHEYLRDQLRNAASDSLYEIGDYLINYINESGYLDCDLLELTLEVNASDEEIAGAVSVIQSLDPPGVGARDLRECMLIQLRCLADEGQGNSVAEAMVRDCYKEMKNRKLRRIARRLKVSPDEARQAVEFVQTKLNPYPAAGFRSPWDHKPSDAKNAVRPDVIVRRTPIGYEVEIVANERLSLAVNSRYRAMYNSLGNRRARDCSDEERKHIIEYVQRADLFVRNLSQRRKTLRNITKCIVEVQQGFLETGSKLFLRPLTRVKVAELLGMHESTVSRATSSKYIQMPNEEVVPFEFFFQSSSSIVDMMVRLVSNEDPAHPLSDQEIADILTERGYPVARRTVVKYREARKILSSRQRRR